MHISNGDNPLLIQLGKEKNMKKLLRVAAISMIPFMASAHDSTGCGLGSMAWRGQQGIVPQLLAVTTNGSFGTQTFGISSGTSGCDQNGRITGGTGKMLVQFMENNMEQYAFDSSRGQGETLYTVAGILGVSEEEVARVSKANFDALFPNEDVDAVTVALNLMDLLNVKA